MVQTRQWVLNNKPSGLPVLEGADATFTIKTAEVAELKDDEVLVKPKYLSNDPAQRGWLRDMEDESRLYVPPVQIGEVMRARALAEVFDVQVIGNCNTFAFLGCAHARERSLYDPVFKLNRPQLKGREERGVLQLLEACG